MFDKRAAADRLGKPNVTALAKEIISANPNAFVIANGVHDDGERVLTFQSAKGYNGLEDRDVYIIVTNLAPDQYEKLNVIGQFLDIPDIIDLHYRDQIAQAVGQEQRVQTIENRINTNGDCHDATPVRTVVADAC